MTYIVKRKIKGNYYYYEQTSYRVGKRVYTKSKYLGTGCLGTECLGTTYSDTASFGTGNLETARDEIPRHETFGHDSSIVNTAHRREDNLDTRESNRETHERKQCDENSEESRPSEVQSSSSTATCKRNSVKPLQEVVQSLVKETNQILSSPKTITSKILNRIDLRAYRISQLSLEKLQMSHMKCLEGVGVNTDHMKPIRLGYGKELTHKKSRSCYILTHPKKKGYRTKFKNEFVKTVAASGLEVLERERPDIYQTFAYHMDEGYRASQNALNTYIMNMDVSNIQKLTHIIAIKWFGYYGNFKKGTFEARHVGLLDFDNTRTSWKDEYSNIMARIHQKGYTTVLKEAKSTYSTTKGVETRLMNANKKHSLLKRLWSRKKIKRNQAQLQAQQALIKNIEVIGTLLQLE